ncbi:MerR family transcriptional regulator [Helicobacter mesocricetorum]|uniref:MerR family transcriptional regulator n=1 Tax=Helicobacter mesocricetorum TaxID=87012 RepID=UPI000CF14E5A|nr:MerR family transcriptional regulator [Helicobacter mesocricetorum]
MAYTIKEVEKETGISSHTLRFWAKKGLFPFVEKDKNGVKYFSNTDVEWVRWIEWFRKSHMSIESIKDYITLAAKGEGTAKQRREMLSEQKKMVIAKMQELDAVLKKLDYKLGVYDEMINKGVDGFNPTSKDYKGCKCQ